MKSGTLWGRFVEKPRGKKSRATVPLKDYIVALFLFVIKNMHSHEMYSVLFDENLCTSKVERNTVYITKCRRTFIKLG